MTRLRLKLIFVKKKCIITNRPFLIINLRINIRSRWSITLVDNSIILMLILILIRILTQQLNGIIYRLNILQFPPIVSLNWKQIGTIYSFIIHNTR